jgi:hypothetical protein
MKTIKFQKVAMTLGGILIATLATGCLYGGGGSGYSSGYSSSYSSYGSSYPYSGYHDSGYRGGYSAAPRVEARPEAQHANVDRDKISLKDSDTVNRTERN